MKARSSLRTLAARGFTLIEVVIVLGVIAILAAFLAPTAFEGIQSSRETATKKQVERIFLAIVGEPSKGNFGYLGDMGRLPANLAELVTQGGQVGYHTSGTVADGANTHKGNVGTGWRGPYVTGTDATDDLFKDAWGLALTYTAGQIVSGGPDGQIATAGDNITYPVQLPVPTTGEVVVTVVVNDIPQPIMITVKVYSTANGEQPILAPVVLQTPNPSVDGKPLRFTLLPQGTSVIETIHVSGGTTVTRITTVNITAGTQVSRTVLMKTSATVPM